MKTKENLLENLKLATLVFCFWSNKSNKDDNLVNCSKDSESFICRVLGARNEAFELGISIPEHLGLLIECCTNGNPGQSLMILSEILEHVPELTMGYKITPYDFIRVYGNKFPVIGLYPEIDSRIEKRWREQKRTRVKSIESDNQCDYPEYWRKFFK